MDLDAVNGKVLKYGIAAAIGIIALGLVLHVSGIAAGHQIMVAGISLLILVPFFGIVASVLSLYTLKDSYWLKVALLLTFITAVGMLVAYF